MAQMNSFKSAVVLFTIFTITTIFPATAQRKSGPFYVQIRELKKCEDEGTGQIRFPTKMSFVGNGKYVYNSSIFWGVPMDEHFTAEVELQQWGNGGYRPRAFYYKFKNCEDIFKYGGHVVKSMLHSAGVEIDGCPVPVLNSTMITNWDMSRFEAANVKTMIYNKFRAISTSFYKNVKVGCTIIDLETVPK